MGKELASSQHGHHTGAFTIHKYVGLFLLFPLRAVLPDFPVVCYSSPQYYFTKDHRPNPIGLSVAHIDRIEGGAVYLSGIDLVDGTPVLDIKPYIPHYDALHAAVAPAWTSEAPVAPLKACLQ